MGCMKVHCRAMYLCTVPKDLLARASEIMGIHTAKVTHKYRQRVRNDALMMTPHCLHSRG